MSERPPKRAAASKQIDYSLTRRRITKMADADGKVEAKDEAKPDAKPPVDVDDLIVNAEVLKENIEDFIDEVSFDITSPSEAISRLEEMRGDFKAIHFKVKWIIGIETYTAQFKMEYDDVITTIKAGITVAQTAKCQGRAIEREIYLIPPEEANLNGKLWRLRKSAYGLADAARNWYISVRDTLIKLNCKQSNLDKAVFRWYHNDTLEGILVLHVDDFMVTGTERFQTVMKALNEKFQVGSRQEGKFKYVGLNIETKTGWIEISQDQYANEIPEVFVETKDRSNDDKLKPHELRNLRGIIGQIQWVASQTRPNLSFDSLELSVERNKATLSTLKRAKKVVKKLKSSPSIIKMKAIGRNPKLCVYPDAGFCNLPDGVSSTQGFVIILEGSDTSTVIDWGSRKIKRKVASTLEAEALSLKETINNAIYIGCLLSEFQFNDFTNNQIPIQVFTDNKPLEQSIRSTKQVQERRLRVDIGEVQRLVNDKEIKDINWIPSDEMLGDGLTKRDRYVEKLKEILI